MQMTLGWRLPRGSLIAGALIAATPLLPASAAQAQQGNIAGQVTDKRTKEAISGVTVQVEGTRFGAITANDGRYRIVNLRAGRYALVARRLGYSSQRDTITVPASGDVTADFALDLGAVSLDQVVVTGTAGAEHVREVGNVVSTIDATTALAQSAAPEMSDLVRGRAPGVNLINTTGRLGAGPGIQIRGASSIGLGDNPLLFIDGVRVDNAVAQGPSSGGLAAQGAHVADRLNDINPDDIESIEIIKGPAAATLYGTEASSGVIQVITKKGAANQKAQFAMDVSNGPIYFRDAAGRVPTNWDSTAMAGLVLWNGVSAEAAAGTPIFKTGWQRHYNGSVSGGQTDSRYYVAAGYQNDLGIESNNSFRNFNTHANLSTWLSPSTEFSSSLNYVNQFSHLGADEGASTLFGAVVGHTLLFPSAQGFFPNYPPAVFQLYDNQDGISRFTGSGTLTNQPASWFSQRAILGIDYTSEDARGIEQYAPPNLAPFLGAAATGRIGQTLRAYNVVTADYSGTAKVNLTPAMTSSTSIGGQMYRTDQNVSTLGGFGFPAPGVDLVSAAANQVASTQSDTLNTTIGAYVEELWGWRNRLFLTAGVRVDNNSAFGNSFKWITYPKVSGSWVVNEEPWWHVSWVNTLRLRAAFGESGRQPQAFSALRLYTPVTGPSSSNAITPGSAGNANLQPERGEETEAGFEAGLFNRLTLSFTYFNKRTLNEIVSQPVAPSGGFPGSQLINLGRVDDHGVELQATYQAITRRDLSWDITANVGTSYNIIRQNVVNAVTSYNEYNIIGYPINGWFSRKVVSADRSPTTGKAINVLCADTAGVYSGQYVKNPTPVACGSAPYVYIGNPNPTALGSLANSVMIGKRLRLYALVDFKAGNTIFNENEFERCAGLIGAPLCEANYRPQRYSPIYLAEASIAAASQNTVDQYMENASFLKLREVSASYELPTRLVPGASRATFSLAARELATLTRYRGIDPESAIGAIDQAVTPPLTRIIATISIAW